MTQDNRNDNFTDPALEAYLDGTLSGDALAVFQSRLSADAVLRATVEHQRAIDQSLSALFAPPDARAAIAGVQELQKVGGRQKAEGEMQNDECRMMNAEKASPSVFHSAFCILTSAFLSRPLPLAPASLRIRPWLAIAALIVFAIGGPLIVWEWRTIMGVGTTKQYAVGRIMPLDQAYRAQVSRGLKPDWICKDQEEFASYFSGRLGQPLKMRDVPQGVAVLGLSYTGGVSPLTLGVLGRSQGQPLVVFADRAGEDKGRSLINDPTLHIYKREIGELMLYEVSALDRPVLLSAFYFPEFPATAPERGS